MLSAYFGVALEMIGVLNEGLIVGPVVRKPSNLNQDLPSNLVSVFNRVKVSFPDFCFSRLHG